MSPFPHGTVKNETAVVGKFSLQLLAYMANQTSRHSMGMDTVEHGMTRHDTIGHGAIVMMCRIVLSCQTLGIGMTL